LSNEICTIPTYSGRTISTGVKYDVGGVAGAASFGLPRAGYGAPSRRCGAGAGSDPQGAWMSANMSSMSVDIYGVVSTMVQGTNDPAPAEENAPFP
jgi:hypothetical protein